MDRDVLLRLEGMLKREKNYADAKEWAIGKLCYSGINGVRDAVDRLRRELADGSTAPDQALVRLIALLEQAMETHRHYQNDEYNYGTSIFMAALDMVGGRREWPNEDELENKRIKKILEEQLAKSGPEPSWWSEQMMAIWRRMLRKWRRRHRN